MSVGLRDQLIRIYAYTDVGVDGLMASAYEYVETQWGRIEPPSAREETHGEKAGFKVEGVVTLGWEAAVEEKSIIAVENQYWHVHAVLPRRGVYEKQLYVSRVLDDVVVVTS